MLNRTTTLTAVLSIALLSCPPGARAAEDTFLAVTRQLDRVVPEELEAGHVPGAVIAVGLRHQLGFTTWQKAYGNSQLQPEPRPMPLDAVFDMASMTKPIATGTSLMILVQQQRVELDAPVSRYLPEFQADSDGPRVTVRHLMTHTSGMPPYVGAATQNQIKEKAGFPCQLATRQHIRQITPTGQPGKTVVYSCLNAILCAEIVETVSGQPLDEFAQRHVFQPLGMTSTGFRPAGSVCQRCLLTTREPYGSGSDGFLQGQVHDPLAAMQNGVSGNAGLFSTAGDISRFAQMMLGEGTLEGARILQSDTVRAMTRVQFPEAVSKRGTPDRRGLLWDLYVPDPDATGAAAVFAYGHTGYTGTAIRIYPDAGVYAIALTNRVHPDDKAQVTGLRRAVWSSLAPLLEATQP